MANWYSDQLTNRNFLSPIGFLFTLDKARKVSFLCQRAEIPTITLGDVNIPTRGLVPIPIEGNITYGEFNVEFIVDEDISSRILTIQKLPDNDKTHILFALDAMIRDAKARLAYS